MFFVELPHGWPQAGWIRYFRSLLSHKGWRSRALVPVTSINNSDAYFSDFCCGGIVGKLAPSGFDIEGLHGNKSGGLISRTRISTLGLASFSAFERVTLYQDIFMSRRNLLLATSALALSAAALPQIAWAQSATAPPGITIVIPITAIGASREASIKGMKAVAAVVRKQPGLIDDVLMQNKNSANKPSHLHVMHWREQKNWEALFSNAEFQNVLKDNAAVLAVTDGAGIYTPLK